LLSKITREEYDDRRIATRRPFGKDRGMTVRTGNGEGRRDQPHAVILILLLTFALSLASVAAATPNSTPETRYVAHWLAPYRAFARAVSASISACFPTDRPNCAPAQLHAAGLAPAAIKALGKYPPPSTLKADSITLRKGLLAVERTLAASARHPNSRAFCRAETGPCTGAFAMVSDAITDMMNVTQLSLPLPE
jgi:hypothetical protein